MGNEKEIDTWDKIVYLVKGIFLLGLSAGATGPDVIQLIEGDEREGSDGRVK